MCCRRTLRLLLVVVFILVQGGCCLGSCSSDALVFSLNVSSNALPFPHFWERCVGSGHALLALREDYRRHLTQCREELGFSGVRFHGLLDDDMSVYLPARQNPYSFFNIDSIFDFLVSLGIRPIVELSFMPEALASSQKTIFHYNGNISPPKDYNEWAKLIASLITHLVQRYGLNEIRLWHFEVWNEPNCGFWASTQQEYFKLYNYTANAVKSVDKLIPVGGPATCQSGWITEFLTFTKANNVPVDFVSTHEYPTDISPPQRNILQQVFKKTRQQVGSLPLFYTEYNAGLGNSMFQDSPYAAAFIASNVAQVSGLVDVFSFWAFSDIFEEGGFVSDPFGIPDRYGLLNLQQIPKPAYRAFQLLHRAGNQTLKIDQKYDTVDAFATINTTNAVQLAEVMVFVSNYNPPPLSVQDEKVCLVVQGQFIGKQLKNSSIERIDRTHANPEGAWEAMGKPPYPTTEQIQKLLQSSIVEKIPLTPTSVAQNSVTFEFVVPANALAVVSLLI